MQQALIYIGLIAIALGLSILSFFGIRKLHREYQKQKLMRNNPVVEIAALKIKAPIWKTVSHTVTRERAAALQV